MILTIAIPTFNRAEKLVKQLERIERSQILSHIDVTVLIVDNASTDDTEKAVQKSNESKLFKYHKNNKNLGLVGNVLRCFELSNSEYCWIVGDDDIVDFSVLDFVLPSLRVKGVGGVIFNAGLKSNPKSKWYPVPFPENIEQSKNVFIEQAFRINPGLFMWISNQILKREVALMFYNQLTPERDILAAPLYACMGCMSKLPFLFYDSTHILINNVDHTSWIKRGRVVAWVDQPTVYLAMLKNNVFPHLAKEKLVSYYKQFKLRSLAGILIKHFSLKLVFRLLKIHIKRMNHLK